MRYVRRRPVPAAAPMPGEAKHGEQPSVRRRDRRGLRGYVPLAERETELTMLAEQAWALPDGLAFDPYALPVREQGELVRLYRIGHGGDHVVKPERLNEQERGRFRELMQEARVQELAECARDRDPQPEGGTT